MGQGREFEAGNTPESFVEQSVNGDHNVIGDHNVVVLGRQTSAGTQPLSASEREVIQLLREHGLEDQLTLLKAIQSAKQRLKRTR